VVKAATYSVALSVERFALLVSDLVVRLSRRCLPTHFLRADQLNPLDVVHAFARLQLLVHHLLERTKHLFFGVLGALVDCRAGLLC